MKKNILLLTLLAMVFAAVPAMSAPVVSLELSDNPVAVGSAFDINVIASGLEVTDPVIGFGFDLDYDDSLFVYNGASVSSSFTDNSGAFEDTDVAGSVFPGVSGDDIFLASLSFTPQSAGDFSLGIVSDMYNPNQGLFTAYDKIDMSGDVTVNATPIPGAVWLFASGLAGLAGIRRRFKK